MKVVLGVGLALLMTAPGKAEVRVADSNGFVIAHDAEVAVSPDDAFVALVQPARWWNGDHSWSGNAANLTVEPRIGGCWCEALPNGGSVEHGRIVTYDPGRRLIVMNSLLGPLMESGLAGRLIWRVEPTEQTGRSRVRLTYQVMMRAGQNPDENAGLAAAVDNVLGEQLVRLSALLNSGRPSPE